MVVYVCRLSSADLSIHLGQLQCASTSVLDSSNELFIQNKMGEAENPV